MATLKIEPITLKSKIGNRVVITGIDPTDTDCIIGEYWSGHDGPHAGSWNLRGIRRGGNEGSNLTVDAIAEISKLARKLGAE